MKFDFLLLDIDDTVLDFKETEKFAFKKTHEEHNISFNESHYLTYRKLNISLWQQFEKGEISLETIKTTRFKSYFKERGINTDSTSFQMDYENNLALSGIIFNDGVIETLNYISQRAKIYAITNGIANIQKNRLKISGIDKFLSGSFVSEYIGVRKPDKVFFDHVEKNIPDFKKESSIVVGDSLSADIPAGLYGYPTCFINRNELDVSKAVVKPDYIISNFYELKKFF